MTFMADKLGPLNAEHKGIYPDLGGLGGAVGERLPRNCQAEFLPARRRAGADLRAELAGGGAVRNIGKQRKPGEQGGGGTRPVQGKSQGLPAFFFFFFFLSRCCAGEWQKLERFVISSWAIPNPIRFNSNWPISIKIGQEQRFGHQFQFALAMNTRFRERGSMHITYRK